MIRDKTQHIAAIIIGLLTLVTIGLHIYSASPSTTKLETSLFSVIEFGLSVAFAWLLAGITNKESFRDSQRQFAVSAYRRITEIDMSLERLLCRLRHQLPQASSATQHELEVLFAMATGTRETIKCSIADWADVIGEELKTIQKISRIRDAKERLLEDAMLTQPSGAAVSAISDVEVNLKKYQDEIARLIESLPPALALSSASERIESSYLLCVDELRDELTETGELKFRGFWDDSFAKDIRQFKVGDTLNVSIGDADRRTSALLVFDPTTKESVGVLVKTSNIGHYAEFCMAATHCVGASSFEIAISTIDPRDGKGRHYFSAVYKPN